MRTNIYRKTMRRRPVMALLVFVLLGVITFGFMVRAIEYIAVDQEIRRLSAYYLPVGQLTPQDPEEWYLDAGADIIAGEDTVAYVDQNRSFLGIMDGVYSADNDAKYDGISDMIYLYGTLSNKTEDVNEKLNITDVNGRGHYKHRYKFTISVDEVTVGYPEYVQPGDQITILWFGPDDGGMMDFYDSVAIDQRYFWKIKIVPYTNGKSIKEHALYLVPMEKGDVYAYPVAAGEQALIQNPEVQADIWYRSINQYCTGVSTTKDMSMIPNMKDYYYLSGGRYLTREDDLAGNRVCVIRQELAQWRNLDIGDHIRVHVYDDQAMFLESATDFDMDATEDVWETYEIVGFFGCTEEEYLTVFQRMMFVPDSTIPAQWTQKPSKGSYSFVLKSPMAKAAFMEHCGERLEQAGFKVDLMDHGGDSFAVASTQLRESSRTGALVMALIMVAVMVLAVAMFLMRYRKIRAIMRALGVGAGRCRRQLLGPAAFIGFAAIAVGGTLSWNYGLKKASEALASLYTAAAGADGAVLSPVWLAGLCLGTFVLWLLMVGMGLRLLGRGSVLGQLQQVSGRGNLRKAPTAEGRGPDAESGHGPAAAGRGSDAESDHGLAAGERETDEEGGHGPTAEGRESDKDGGHGPTVVEVNGQNTQAAKAGPRGQAPGAVSDQPLGRRTLGTASPLGRRSRGIVPLLRHMGRHIRRTPWRVAMTGIVAAGFIIALGWMTWTIEKNEQKIEEFYEQVPVVGSVVIQNSAVRFYDNGVVPDEVVEEIKNSGFIEDLYLEGASSASAAALGENGRPNMHTRTIPTNICAIDQPDKYPPFLDGSIQIEYMDGYDASIFEITKDVPESRLLSVILPSQVMEKAWVSLGSTVCLWNPVTDNMLQMKVVGQYESDTYDHILMPMATLVRMVGRNHLRYATVEFRVIPEMNRQLDKFQSAMDAILEKPISQKVTKLSCVVRDEELKQAVEPLSKSIRLMRILYPVVAVIAVLVTGLICMLIIFQCAQEAAIMRILGTGKGSVAAVLCLEQLLPCLAGLGLGMVAVICLFKGASGAVILSGAACALGCLAGGIAASIMTAVMVAGRKPMTLLGVKE